MKSESDSIHKAHADILQMENGHLLSKIQTLTEQLKKANEIIEALWVDGNCEYCVHNYVVQKNYISTRDKTSQTEIT